MTSDAMIDDPARREPVGFELRPIGIVRSPLARREDAPRQGFLGAPEAWLEIDPRLSDGLLGLAPGAEIIVVTWLHQARRDRLKGRNHRHPDADIGVFATRSPNRPNPIGLHRVTIREIAPPNRLLVHPLEALDGTPIIDLKPVLRRPTA